MNELFRLLRQFFQSFQVWMIVAPWEQTIRVRLGKHTTLLGAGVHLKLPLVDRFYTQSVRLRVSALGRQTITDPSGRCITLQGSIGYTIDDIGKLYRSVHHAEDTLTQLARSEIAQFVSTTPDCTPRLIEGHLSDKLDLSQYGLGGAKVYITEFAVVRTYRLIGDYGSGTFGTMLNTEYSQAFSSNTPPSA